MAPVPGRHAGTTLMLAVCLMIALPGLLVVARAAPASSGVPPRLDGFLAAVRDATPPHARLLAYGAPPALIFYRATYLLYPRTVCSAAATDYAHGSVASALPWPTVRRLAHRDGARYVIVWALPLAVHGTVLLRSGAGTLIEIAP